MDPFKVKDPRPGIASVSTAKKMSKTPPNPSRKPTPQPAVAAAATKERKTSDVRRRAVQKAGREAARGNFSKKKPRKKDMTKGGY